MALGQDYLDALAGLRPVEVAVYLSNAGWQDVEQIGRSSLWVLGDDENELEVLLPRDPEVRDYLPRMVALLQTLAEVEDRPRPEILRDLRSADVDTQYFRIFPESPSGTMPVADAVEAYGGLRDLFVAAAYSVEGTPALNLPRRKPRKVEDFPRHVLLRPPREGSYVIAAEVPLGSAANDGALFPVEQPFSRRALLRLYDTVRSARDAANEALESCDLSPFADRVGEGISMNLCRGLARLSGADRDRPFEIRFSWANTLSPGVATAPLRFDEAAVTMLAQAEEDLGSTGSEERAEVIGTVWKTEREHPMSPGWVIVRGVTSSTGEGSSTRNRHVWVRLAPEQFSLALRAADHGLPLQAEGRLIRTGRRTELDQLRSFTLLEAR